jgi:hypothetical protein
LTPSRIIALKAPCEASSSRRSSPAWEPCGPGPRRPFSTKRGLSRAFELAEADRAVGQPRLEGEPQQDADPADFVADSHDATSLAQFAAVAQQVLGRDLVNRDALAEMRQRLLARRVVVVESPRGDFADLLLMPLVSQKDVAQLAEGQPGIVWRRVTASFQVILDAELFFERGVLVLAEVEVAAANYLPVLAGRMPPERKAGFAGLCARAALARMAHVGPRL